MESITKSKLTHEKVDAMTKKAFGNNIELEAVTELTDGFFNTAYMVTLADGFKAILKVAPPKNVKVMRYEKNIMETEVYVLNKINTIKAIPVPKVYYYDQSGEIIENDFFFMEVISGIPYNKLKSELTEEDQKKIASQLGAFVEQIHSEKGSYFGYISQVDKRFETWDKAFLCMIKELLDDAADAGVTLPYSYDKIYDIVYEKRNILKAVKAPSLVHKDLWEGNIFVDPATVKITGLIDCERALYGDTLLEPVCAFLLQNEDFMKNYIGRVCLDKDEEIRAALYKVYLYLIMFVECFYRKYPDENSSKWAGAQLEAALAELLKL